MEVRTAAALFANGASPEVLFWLAVPEVLTSGHKDYQSFCINSLKKQASTMPYWARKKCAPVIPYAVPVMNLCSDDGLSEYPVLNNYGIKKL